MVQISSEMIAAAEQLLGVTYTEAERRQMVDNFAPQVEHALRRRALALPNHAPPALRFDPRLPGSRPPEAPAPAPGTANRWLAAGPAKPPADEAEIAFAPVAHLSRWLASGALSSRRLTEIYLSRIDRHAGGLDCYVTVAARRARAEADAMDALTRASIRLGPLHGIPYALKDIFDVRGLPVTWGAEPFRDRRAKADAAVADRLRRAGAVLLGKSSVGALAYGDIWLGRKTRNPWNLAEGASGSSAGSAAATVAGLCGFSIGTETLGSIVSPSDRCGATGLRPTYGRVSRFGCMALCWSLDKVGPICRSVADTGLVLDAINGGDRRDPGSIDVPFKHDSGRGVEGLRIGFLPGHYAAGGPATGLDHRVLERLRGLGFELVEVALPDLPYESLIATLYAEAAASFEPLTLSGEDDSLTRQDAGAWPNVFRKARFLSAVDHVQLDRLRRRVMEAVDSLFERADLVVGPVDAEPMLVATNFSGHPCLVLPAGFERRPVRAELSLAAGRLELGEGGSAGPEFEAPRGVCLWGRLFDESLLLRVGERLEAALDLGRRRPPPAADAPDLPAAASGGDRR